MERWLLVFGLVGALLQAPAQTIDSAAVDAIAAEALRVSGLPGMAVAIVKGDEVVYLKGHGLRDASSGKPVTPDTLFAIGSMTKAFTTAAIAMLVDEGRMRWDDPVREHLSYFRLSDPLADAQVTIRDLVTHRTGLAPHDLLWRWAPWPVEETFRRAAYLDPQFPFRSRYLYNNIMYNAAGHALAGAAGMPWHEFVQKRILDPLGMKGVRFTASSAQQTPDWSAAHVNGKVTPWYPDDRQIRPAGSIKANVRDLTHWMRFVLGDGTYDGKLLLSSQQMRELHRPQVTEPEPGPGEEMSSYALGWRVAVYRGHLTWTHGGAVPGFRSRVALLPAERLGVVVLANDDKAWVQESVTRTIVDQLLGLPRRDWHKEFLDRGVREAERARMLVTERARARRAGTAPSKPLAAYAGAFRDPAYGVVRIVEEKGSLALRWSSFQAPLRHWESDTFDVLEERFDNAQARFEAASDGIYAVHFLGRRFRRIQPQYGADVVTRWILEALHLRKGERILMRYDPETLADLVPRLESWSQMYGGQSLAPVKAADPLPGLDNVDVFLWLPLGPKARQLDAAERKKLGAWLDQGGARREIHFHWADGSRKPDGLEGEHSEELDEAYMAALGIDHVALSARQERAIELMRKGSTRISTPAGTDFFFRTGTRPFNKQNGDASPERAAAAKVRVDREIELPAGVVRVAPVEETAAGVIVLPEARFGGTIAKKVRLYIDNGRITRIQADEGQAAVEAALKGGGDAAMRFREFGLGFNPKLPGVSYFGYGAGVVRLSLGDNEELGGKVRGGFTRWFFFPDANVHVDGKYLVRNGKLVVPE